MYEFLNLDEVVHANKKAGNSTVIVIVVVVLIVGALAWWGIMDKNDDATLTTTEDTLNQDTPMVQDTTPATNNELRARLDNARTDLLALQAQLEADANEEEALQALEELEATLEENYANVDAETTEQWNEIKAEFDRLETAIREGSADTM